MASHEWFLEDIVNIEELEDNGHEINHPDMSSEIPDDDPSRSFFALNLPEPNGSLSISSPSLQSNLAGHNTSPGSMQGYDLSSSLNEDHSALALPPNTYDVYNSPWSPLNISDAYPRTTPDLLLDRKGWQIDSDVAQPSNPEQTMTVSRLSNELSDGIARSLPDVEAALPSASSDSPDPLTSLNLTHELWKDPSNAISFTSAGAWPQYCTSADSTTASVRPVLPNLATTPHQITSSFMSSPSGDNGLATPEPFTYPSPGFDACISPSDTVHSHAVASPTPQTGSGDSWWPLPDLLLPEQQQQQHAQPFQPAQPVPPNIGLSSSMPQLSENIFDGLPLSPFPGHQDGYERLIRHAVNKWGNVGGREQEVRDEALLEMRKWGLSYKDIKQIGNFPDALPTLRGRHRILTKPMQDRVRRPPWQPRDEQLLQEAVRAQLSRPRARPHQRIIWKDVADHMNQRGASYNFSYVTCSQKWQQMIHGSQMAQRTRAVRGRGAITG